MRLRPIRASGWGRGIGGAGFDCLKIRISGVLWDAMSIFVLAPPVELAGCYQPSLRDGKTARRNAAMRLARALPG